MKKLLDSKFGALLPVLVCAFLIVAVFATGILGKSQTWGFMQYADLRMAQGVSLRESDGAVHGVVSGGPGYSLSAGHYRLKWDLVTDGAGVIRLASGNNAEIVPNEFAFRADDAANVAEFDILEDCSGFDILIDWQSGGMLDVNDVRLYAKEYADNAFTFSFVLIALCALVLAARRGALGADRRGRIVLLAAAVALSCVPVMKDNFGMVYDTGFHMARIANLADGLRQGQFPVRVGGFSYNGYGAVTSAFYPDLFLYPFAAMLLCGASIQYVMSLSCVAASAVAAITMYACGKRVFADKDAGVLASILYVLSSYRINDMYVRCALGEYWAMAFLPLFILGLWEVVFGERDRWPLLALGAAAIFMSHVLTTVMAACLAVAFCAPMILRIVKNGRLLPLIKAAICAGLLCAFFLLPFLMYSRDGISAEAITANRRLADTAMHPAQLFLLGEGDLPADPMDSRLPGTPLEIGLPLLGGLLLMIYGAATKEQKKDDGQNMALCFGAGGVLFAVLCTTIFPWNYVSVVTGLFDMLQFAWRFLAIATPLLALSAGWAYAKALPEQRRILPVFVLIAAFAYVLPTIGAVTRSNDYLRFGEGANPDIGGYAEYNLPGTDPRDTLDRLPIAGEGVTIEDFSKDGTCMHMQVSAQQAGRVTLPVFGFRGYAALLSGVRLATGLGENNRLLVEIPAGASGQLDIWFEGQRIWRVADAVSLLSAAGLAVSFIIRKKKSAKRDKR